MPPQSGRCPALQSMAPRDRNDLMPCPPRCPILYSSHSLPAAPGASWSDYHFHYLRIMAHLPQVGAHFVNSFSSVFAQNSDADRHTVLPASGPHSWSFPSPGGLIPGSVAQNTSRKQPEQARSLEPTKQNANMTRRPVESAAETPDRAIGTATLPSRPISGGRSPSTPERLGAHQPTCRNVDPSTPRRGSVQWYMAPTDSRMSHHSAIFTAISIASPAF